MRILVEKGKHDTEYYDVSTNELLAATALHILTERFEANWYWKPTLDDFYYGHEKETFLTEEEIKALPEHLQGKEIDKLRKLKACKVRLIVEEGKYEEIERIVKEQDASFETVKRMKRDYVEIPAWSALENRFDHYEYMFLVEPMNVRNKK